MSKNLRNQLEGLFSGVVPEPEAEKRDEPLLEEVVEDLLEGEVEPVAAEPVVAEAPLPIPTGLEEAEEERPGISPPSELALEAALREQHVRILNTLLVSAIGIGAVAVVALLISLAQRPSRFVAYIPYFVTYLVLVGVGLARRLNPTLRVTVLVTIVYIVGVFSLLRNGPLGTGGLYLLIAPLMLSLFLRRWGGMVTAGVSIAVYTAFVIAHYQGWLQPAAVFDLTQLYFALILGGTFVMIVVGVMFVQWMFNISLTNALQEAERKHIQVMESQALLKERADELATTTTLLRKLTFQLQAAAEVSRAAASVLDLGELVHQVVNLIRERFGLYYVGLFLIDESGEWAVLQAGPGEAGRQMLEQGYRLKVGGSSRVGWCTAHAQACIALDTDERAARFDDLLPQTRSEMALPLVSHGRVIGALDVYSTEHEAFSQEDISVLQTMADQVAVAISNAQLFAETQAGLEELEATQRRYLREQWTEFVPGQVARSYERTQPDVAPLGDVMLPDVEQAMVRRGMVVRSGTGDGTDHAAVVAPISLRGQVIGALGLHETEDKRWWTDEELALIETVADQMALAIENARLFEQTQSRAARERLIREITDRFRGAVDIESILQMTVQEVSKALGASHGLVRLGTEVELGGTSRSTNRE